jgi:uncharacterized protein DUF4365
MDVSQRKEQFSRGWLRAVAAVSGYEVAEGPRVDDDSIDCTIIVRGQFGAYRSPRLDVQLKCTSAERDGDPIRFRLSRKNYEDLRGEDVATPRVLIVLFVPIELAAWSAPSDDELRLRHCAYWKSLRFNLPLPDGQQSKTVDLNREQRVTPEALENIMALIGNGTPP